VSYFDECQQVWGMAQDLDRGSTRETATDVRLLLELDPDGTSTLRHAAWIGARAWAKEGLGADAEPTGRMLGELLGMVDQLADDDQAALVLRDRLVTYGLACMWAVGEHLAEVGGLVDDAIGT